MFMYVEFETSPPHPTPNSLVLHCHYHKTERYQQIQQSPQQWKSHQQNTNAVTISLQPELTPTQQNTASHNTHTATQ
jgi:hypothetical protein